MLSLPYIKILNLDHINHYKNTIIYVNLKPQPSFYPFFEKSNDQ